MDERAFGAFLVKEGFVRAELLEQAVETQKLFPARIDSVLLGIGSVPERTLEKALGKFLKARTATAADLASVDKKVAWILSPRVVRRFKVLPFRKEGNRLSLASLHPLDLLVEDELALLSGCMVSSFVALEARMMESLRKFHGFDLSFQMDSVIKKLHGKPGGGGIPVVQLKSSAVAAPPAPDPAAAPVAPAPRPLPQRAKPPVVAPPKDVEEPVVRAPDPEIAELGLDEEDMALFPSLVMSEPAEEAAAEPERVAAPAPVAPQSPTPPPPTLPPPTPPPPTPPPVAEVPEPQAPEPETVQEPPPPEPEPEPEPEPIELPPMEEEELPMTADLTDEERLVVASTALQGVEMRDDIGDAVLDFCAPFFKRRMLLILRKGVVVGWRGEGEGVDEMTVKAIAIPVSEPSVFLGLTKGMAFWLGALPPMARNIELVFGLGGGEPKECVILPVTVKDRIVCFFYGDNMTENVSGVPMGLIRRLIAKAGMAFQIYIMKSKLRRL